MFKNLFVTVSDKGYFFGLQALLNSIYVYHKSDVPVRVYYRGFTKAEFEWIGRHPLRIELHRSDDLPYPTPGMWEAKQQVMAHCIGVADNVFLLDADVILTSSMDDVFESAASGNIVGGADGGAISYNADFSVYSENIVGTSHPYINTGALCMNVQDHWILAGLWGFSSQYAEYSPTHGYPLSLPGHGDQGLFNALLATLNKLSACDILPHRLWNEPGAESAMEIRDTTADGKISVFNVNANKQQRILHATGGKWWTEDGAAKQRHFGDKLKCFFHFAELRTISALHTC